MIRRALLVPTVMGGGQTYAEKVAALGPIAYWPMTETTGTTLTATVGANGTYLRDVSTMGTAAGPVSGETAPTFDGTNDGANIYTTTLRDAFNGQEGAISAWMKVSGSGVWSDSAFRRVIRLWVNDSNQISLFKTSAANTFTFSYIAGGTTDSVGLTTSSTAWLHIGAVWSKTGDYFRAYVDGAQTGTDQTSLGTFAGTLSTAQNVIGCSATTPAQVWSGNIAHVAIFATPLTTPQMATLATV